MVLWGERRLINDLKLKKGAGGGLLRRGLTINFVFFQAKRMGAIYLRARLEHSTSLKKLTQLRSTHGSRFPVTDIWIAFLAKQRSMMFSHTF